MKIASYDPQDVIGNTIGELERQDPFALCPVEVQGGGVYVLYYAGPHDLYREIRSPDATVPIYVGSTINMASRLRGHCRSLDSVWNLERKDFLCRCLLLPRGMELWVEQEFMALRKPWWNQPEFKGFGTGHPRNDGHASPWDVLHPGRKAALKLNRPDEAKVQLQKKLAVQEQLQPTILDLFPPLSR